MEPQLPPHHPSRCMLVLSLRLQVPSLHILRAACQLEPRPQLAHLPSGTKALRALEASSMSLALPLPQLYLPSTGEATGAWAPLLHTQSFPLLVNRLPDTSRRPTPTQPPPSPVGSKRSTSRQTLSMQPVPPLQRLPEDLTSREAASPSTPFPAFSKQRREPFPPPLSTF